MSNKEINNEIQKLFKQTVVRVTDTKLPRDLWPQMLRKLNEQPAHSKSVPWFDWALAAVVSAILIFFPEFIPALLYHL